MNYYSHKTPKGNVGKGTSQKLADEQAAKMDANGCTDCTGCTDYDTSRSSSISGISGALESQIGGAHYTKMGDYQPWKVAAHWLTPEELKGAMKLTVMAYLAREADKNGRQDIEKAMHTIQIYLELSKHEG